jgi:molybdopterin molybdotransferase
MITVEEALARCLALVSPTGVVEVALRAARGRVLAQPVAARLTQPPFAAAAMDGYALGSVGAIGDTFTVVGEAGAGHALNRHIAPHEAARIFTGAPVPSGAVTVIMQEEIAVEGDQITLTAAAPDATHIRPRGQDFNEGEALAAPRFLGPNDLALCAAMNLPRLPVHRRPVVAVFGTGDELVMPGEEPGPDQIICSNTFAIAALAEAAGAEVRMLPIARDDEAHLRVVFGLAKGADLVVTAGGASVGDHDLVGKVAADLGLERAFWKIAMRPGKPLMAGRLGDAAMLGLPGNPVSAIVCAHLFMLPMIARLQGLASAAAAPRKARLGADVGPTGPRTHFMRARLDADGVVTPFDRQDSALLKILTEANALLIRPMNDGPRRTGETVEYYPL